MQNKALCSVEQACDILCHIIGEMVLKTLLKRVGGQPQPPEEAFSILSLNLGHPN